MTEVQPITKDSQLNPVRVPCACQCGVEGTPKRKASKDGLHHAHLCKCRSCIGTRNRRGGQTKASKWRKAAAVPDARFKSLHGNEETWADQEYRYEHKADLLNAKPINSAYERMLAQSDSQKAIGDTRPFVAGTTYNGKLLATAEAKVWADLRNENLRLRAILNEMQAGA